MTRHLPIELPVQSRRRDDLGLTMSPSFGIAGGTTEVLKNLIGERVLGLAKEPGPT